MWVLKVALKWNRSEEIGAFSYGSQLVVEVGFLMLWPILLSYSTSPGFLTLESIVLKIRLVGNFFVMDRFMYSGNRR